MAYLNRINVNDLDTLLSRNDLDSFERLKVSNTNVMFDSKFVVDEQPIMWSTAVGGGGLNTYNSSIKSVDLTVTGGTDYVKSQSKRKFQNQSGTSHNLIVCATANKQANVTKRIGLFDSNIVAPYNDVDGVYFEITGSDISIVTARAGVIQNNITQANWNVDKLNGLGSSGLTLNLANMQLFHIEWCYGNVINCGFIINGRFVVVNTIQGSNSIVQPLFSSSNKNVRLEIISSGGAGVINHFFSTVYEEGSKSPNGLFRSFDTSRTYSGSAFSVGALFRTSSSNTLYPIFGIRQKTPNLTTSVSPRTVSITNPGAGLSYQYYLMAIQEGWGAVSHGSWGTIGNSLTNIPQSAIEGLTQFQTVNIPTSNILTALTTAQQLSARIIGSGFVSSDISSIILPTDTNWFFGSTINGKRDELLLAVSSGFATQDFAASLTWVETE